MTFDPTLARYLVMIGAVASFIVFLAVIYIPHVRDASTPRRDFFKNVSALLDTLVFLLLYAVLFSALFLFPNELLSPALSYPGMAIALLGLGLALAGRLTLRDNWQPVTNADTPKSLRTTSIFSYLRHPIYTGRVLFFAGVMIMFASPLLILTLPYWYLLHRKAAEEERLLCEAMPEYAAYQHSTFSPF